MTPHHPDLGDPEAAAINRHMERPRMSPCDCNREMGDRCARCAPTPEPDRSGWPVLTRRNDYNWSGSDDLAVGNVDGTGKTWSAWRQGVNGKRVGFYPTAQAAADAIQARLPEDVAPVTAPDSRDAEIATLREQVEAFRRAACVALGYGENTTPGDSTLLRDLRAMDIKNLGERAESAEATLDAYRIQRDQAREDAAGLRRLLNDAAALRAAAAEACDCDDGEVPADAELARRLRELDTDGDRDLAVVRDVIGTCTESIRKLVCEGRQDTTAIAITGLCAVIERVVGVARG